MVRIGKSQLALIDSPLATPEPCPLVLVLVSCYLYLASCNLYQVVVEIAVLLIGRIHIRALRLYSKG